MKIVKLGLKRPSLETQPPMPRRSRRQSRTFTFNGETKGIAEWARTVGMKTCTLADRLVLHGWPIERALTEPVMGVRQRNLLTRNTRLIARIAEGFRSEASQ